MIPMAHVGRLYPVHFRRDLSFANPFPQQLPERWVYTQDDLTVDHDHGQHRFTQVSGVGQVITTFNGLEWLFSYAGDAGIACEIRLRYTIVNQGQPNISNLPGCLWRLTYNNALAIGSGYCESFGRGSQVGYPIQFHPVAAGDDVFPPVTSFGFQLTCPFGTPEIILDPKRW